MSSEVKTQFAQITSDLASLSARVDRMAYALTVPVLEAEFPVSLPATRAELLDHLGKDFSEPDWAELFDAVADAGIFSSYLPQLALDALTSVRGSVRAAAARALAASDEATAVRVLPSVIAKESNAVAASIMRSALASARQ